MLSQSPAQEKAVEPYHSPAPHRFQSWWQQLGNHAEDMALGLVLWICTLPLVALILLLITLLICWSVCLWRIKTPIKEVDHEKSET